MYKRQVFCLKRAPVRGRNVNIEEKRGQEVTGLRDAEMEKDGTDLLER